MSTAGLFCEIFFSLFDGNTVITRFLSEKNTIIIFFIMFIIDVFFEFNLDMTRYLLETPEACNYFKVAGEN